MTMVVEDGTGKTDSNSYGAVADADTYFSDRGITAWTGASTLKEYALIKATDYIDTVFGSRFKGKKVDSDTQALEFPRTPPCITGIPTVLKKACYEYALRALTSTLLPDPEMQSNGLRVVSTVQIAGPLEEHVTYSDTHSMQILKPYPAADKLLRALLNSSGSVIR